MSNTATETKKGITNMNVNVTFTLSPKGQRAALLAGLSAAQKQTLSLPLTDLALIDSITVAADGTAKLEVYQSWYPELDSVPATVDEVLTILSAAEAQKAAKRAAEKAAEEARETERQAQIAAWRIEDAPRIREVLDIYAAGGDLPDDVCYTSAYTDGQYFAILGKRGANRNMEMTIEERQELKAISAARDAAQKAADAAKQAAKQAEIDVMVAKRGGIVWPVVGGMCDFAGRGLWRSSQDRRWVGVFSSPRGIDKFLDSPRGEHNFCVSPLEVGNTIQGAGFQNRRGKRSNESEFFGVVREITATEIVITMCDSRSEAMRAAAKLAAEVI